MNKTTNKDLVDELEKRNESGKYDELIAKAKANWYHDFKAPENVSFPKSELNADLSRYPELIGLRERVLDGEFDEEPDDDDMQDIANSFKNA